jgi:bacillithiol biosynthesis cysteine-adding enzyme BshC
LNPTEFKAETLSVLSAAYAAGRTFPEAFASWMNRLLGDSGLIFVNPNDARLKEPAAPFFIEEVGLDGSSQAKVAAVNEKLLAAGYHIQVHKNKELVNLFYQPARRQALRKGEGGFVTDGNERFTSVELEAAVREKPENFSPNVLLRPVLQSYLFPVVSAVLGPSEVAYFAQIAPLFDLHKLPFPIVYPRKSVTLLESRVGKILERHHLSVLDFAGNAEALLGRLVREEEGRELETKVLFARQSVKEAMEALKRELAGLDPTLEKTAEQAQAKLDLEIQNLEKKGVAAVKRKSETLREQVYRAKDFLFPEGELQERKLNAGYFLVKHGLDLLPRLRAQIDFENFDHQVVAL